MKTLLLILISSLLLFLASCGQNDKSISDAENTVALSEQQKTTICDCAKVNFLIFKEVQALENKTDSIAIIKIMDKEKDKLIKCEEFGNSISSKRMNSLVLEYLSKCEDAKAFDAILNK